ncbi:MAG TPA: hypothetical protein VGE59_04425 [Patescibacteria group bacterium]
MAENLYQLTKRETGERVGLPRERGIVVREAMRLINKPSGFDIITYPDQWEEGTGEVHVGTRAPGEDALPVGELDAYEYVIRPATADDLAAASAD